MEHSIPDIYELLTGEDFKNSSIGMPVKLRVGSKNGSALQSELRDISDDAEVSLGVVSQKYPDGVVVLNCIRVNFDGMYLELLANGEKRYGGDVPKNIRFHWEQFVDSHRI